MNNSQDIKDFIDAFGFATIVSANLQATHVPLLFKHDEGENGVLYGHVAKANGHWKHMAGESLLAIFSGPHAYISPTWYAKGPAVPTWNYAAVHCYGQVVLLGEEDTLQVVSELVAQYEPELNEPELNEPELNEPELNEPELNDNLALMPAEYQAKLNKAIVGFKIMVSSIQAKEKLGQQRSSADQQGVYATLASSNREDDRMLAHYMDKRNLGTGSESK